MSTGLMHIRTKKQIELFAKNPSHALLITGLMGSGKYYVAQQIGVLLLKLKAVTDLYGYPYYIHISKPDDKQEISIDTIRELIHKLRLKTPGKQGIRRVVVIEDAYLLSEEAQNAILKILEEPPADTVILLTAPSSRSVLPTIASRAQQLEVLPTSLKNAVAHFGGKYNDSETESAWNLSEGAAGLMIALLNDSQNHPLKESVNNVKLLLKLDTYERLLMLDALSKDKEALALFLDAVLRVLAALNHTSGVTNRQILACRKLVLNLQEQLSNNANPRLVALTLGLKLDI